MNAADQLDYALGLLDDRRRELADAERGADPALSDRLRRLEASLGRLLDDGDEIEPPRDLATRTIERVAEQRSRRRSILEFAPPRMPFRWGDLAVAAGIFFAAVATLLPALNKSRASADLAACALNLQRIGVSLNQYAGANGSYPYVDPSGEAPYAGTYAVLLKDKGYVADPNLFECPGDETCEMPASIPDYSTLAAHDRQSPRSAACLKNLSYGYNLGCQQAGRPAPIPARVPETIALLSDRPRFQDPRTILAGNSRNHDGSGQNVLYAGGNVRFHPTRRLGPDDDDMFLNAQRRAAPGVGLSDAVLAPGTSRFDGE